MQLQHMSPEFLFCLQLLVRLVKIQKNKIFKENQYGNILVINLWVQVMIEGYAHRNNRHYNVYYF